MATVNIGRNRLTDKEMQIVLQKICDIFRKNINVIKGEVIYPKRYEHKDMEWIWDVCIGFRIEGIEDILAYQALKLTVESVFLKIHSYKIVLYGQYSERSPGIYIYLNKKGYGTAAFYQYGTYPGGDYFLWEEQFFIQMGRVDNYFDSIKAKAQ